MLEFLDEELGEEERKLFKKIVSYQFDQIRRGADSQIDKKVYDWIEQKARETENVD